MYHLTFQRLSYEVVLINISVYALGLTLVSAPHLARSYHHLFPLDAFQEVSLEDYKGERYIVLINFYVTVVNFETIIT